MLYQYNSGGRRWYYDGQTWYASVTEFVKNSMPTPEFLIKWYKENSEQFIENKMNESAKFGTAFHDYMEILTANGSLDPLSVDRQYGQRMLTMIASGAQFLHDIEANPIAIEARMKYISTHRFPLNMAGTVDLVAETSRWGLAIIDYKTGNIWESHKYQMMCYALAYCQENPSVDINEITMVNMRPKEWRGPKITYETKKWVVTLEDWDRLSNMMSLFSFSEPKKMREFSTFTLGLPPSYREKNPVDHTDDEDIF